MGRSIIYDRKFISVLDKFIPIFQCGSSNCTELSPSGREVLEKYWTAFNHKQQYKLLFTKEEIKEMAEYYSRDQYYKNYNTSFKDGEFVRWYTNGVKTAKSIEYYLQYGNSMFIIEYGPNDYRETHNIYSTEDLIEYIEKVEVKNLFGIQYTLDIRFYERNLRLPKKRKVPGKKKEHPNYYILSSRVGYFVRKTKWGYKYAYYRSSYQIKKFKSEMEAIKYLEKYPSLKKDFKIEKIDETAML